MSAVSGELAHYWSHPGLPDVGLLRARFVTHRFGRHAHEGYTVGLIESGVEEFHREGTLMRAGPGAVVIVNPETVHTGHAGVPEGWAYRAAYPPVAVLTEIAAEFGARPGTPYFRDAVIDDPQSARLLRAAYRAAQHGDALAAASRLRSALAGLLHRHGGVSPERRRDRCAPTAVRAARDILHERLVDPPSLEELAREVGARPFTLLKAFRAATGLPPHAYLNHLRVRRARHLLDEGLRAAEVAARTGFADQAHLTRHFKRTFGVPPGAYQLGRTRVSAPSPEPWTSTPEEPGKPVKLGKPGDPAITFKTGPGPLP
ncbi:AraC family transcriptional regulator [Actinomadura sp. HBU206391]|uniref:AraC family transcriptional regulator n=1 Tax=Actinomadura sp. HBU206391 TaxID=2731692 RepID=UPI00164F25E4|nr:AraC family transcriptional regulator [Actinomadura sp. HBU206391]MBC6461559.1 AraC family transcriptional regulator [Actinomadura sp. HBU206391]